MTECVCGAVNVDVIGEKDQRTVGRCTNCKLLRTLNPPDDYLSLYTDGDRYHVGQRVPSLLDPQISQIPYRDRFEHDVKVAQSRWPKLMRQFRLLDVGCANGGFVKWAREQGMRVEGLEVNPTMATWAREHTDCQIHTSWNTVVGLFDIITYHDVIEHILDPRDEIWRAADRLRSEGLLVLDTPDADDPRFAELGMEWHHMRTHEHLWFFTGPQLVALVRQCGLTVEKVDRPIQGKVVVYARK